MGSWVYNVYNNLFVLVFVDFVYMGFSRLKVNLKFCEGQGTSILNMRAHVIDLNLTDLNTLMLSQWLDGGVLVVFTLDFKSVH